MASEKQLQANRANAKKSTGPKTEIGKSRSRRNAWKHGLTAESIIIAGEDGSEFEQLRAALMEGHQPASALEAELVERLAAILWRLRRVPFFEAAILDARQAEIFEEHRRNDHCYGDEEMSDDEWRLHVGEILTQDCGLAIGNLSRYETTLTNLMSKTLAMLLLLQENRIDARVLPTIEGVAIPS